MIEECLCKMARVISKDVEKTDFQTGALARLDDVSFEKMKQRYMEDVKSGKLPDDNRKPEEIQEEEDTKELAEFIDFFELDDFEYDPNRDDPKTASDRLSEQLSESQRGILETAISQMETNIKEDAAQNIEQVEEFTVNDKDPFLAQEYKEKSERIIKNWALESEKESERETRTSTRASYEEPSRTSTFNSGSGFAHKSQYSNGGTRTTTGTVSNSQSSTVFNKTTDDERIRQQFGLGASKARDFAINSKFRDEEENFVSNAYRFGGKKKWGLRYMKDVTLSWMKTKKAKRLLKVAAAICLETSLAVMTKQFEFDGPTQLLSFVGMTLGIFYLTSELAKEGYDQRRLAFI